MKKIYKYKLPRDGEVITITDHIVKWLDIHEQNGWPHIWAIVDTDGSHESREIVAWGTGWMVPDELMFMSYLGTCEDGAGYVWHYFTRDITPLYDTITVTDEYNPYDYTLTTKGCPDPGYSITISCGDPDSAVCGLTADKVCSESATTIDALQSALEYITATVANSQTATAKAYL